MKMISDGMAAKLNEQIGEEFNSYWIYLAMAYKLENMNLKIFAKWFFKQADEEKVHAMKFAGYLIDQGAEVKLATLDTPKSDYGSVKDIVKTAVDHEVHITKCINGLVDAARKDNDHATESFLKWYVDEQVEEVASTTELFDMVSMAETPGQIFMLENRVWHMVQGRE